MKNVKKVGDWVLAPHLKPGDMIWHPPELGFRLLIASTSEKGSFALVWITCNGNMDTLFVEANMNDMALFRITDQNIL